MDQPYVLPHVRRAVQDALSRAGLTAIDDVDGVETHDCFSTSEYMAIDHLGITAPGESWKAIENGDLVTLITTDQVAEQVNFAERLNQALPGLAAAADPAQLFLAATPKLRNMVLLGRSQLPGFLTEAQFLERAAQVSEDAVHESRLAVRLRDVAIMLYTSGTTANPKGCLLTHEAMVRNSISLGRHRYALKHEDVFWSPLPMFHIAAILPMCAIFDVGGAYATMGHFEAGAALAMLAGEKVTATYPCFVTIMSDLIHHKDFPTTDLSRITS